MADDIELELKVVFDEWAKKAEDCKDGHKEPCDLIYVVSSRSNPLRDKAQGYCRHCNAFYDRPLRSEELDSISKVQKMLHGGSDVFMKASDHSGSYSIRSSNP